MTAKSKLVFIGLSLSSSWGNGHATTYRALLKALAERGHEIAFLEQDRDYYAAHRDIGEPDYCALHFYKTQHDLNRYRRILIEADAVVIGSYVSHAPAIQTLCREIGCRLVAFYDIDTPVTLASVERGDCKYLTRDTIRDYDLYFSFTGGPVLDRLEEDFGSPRAQALYCSVDADLYRPMRTAGIYDLGYLGTYSPDRQPILERLLLEPARRAPHLRFVVAGPQYPATILWPENVTRIDHVGPTDHCAFYSACRYTLNVTRADMVAAGYSPSVRLFEAAACGTPIITDDWEGLDTFFKRGEEIAVASRSEDVLALLTQTDEALRKGMAARARAHVLEKHTSRQRAVEFEQGIKAAISDVSARVRRPAAV